MLIWAGPVTQTYQGCTERFDVSAEMRSRNVSETVLRPLGCFAVSDLILCILALGDCTQCNSLHRCI